MGDQRENGDAHAAPRSFGQRLGDALREPLTPLTILLLLGCLLFLLLSSVFIGLYAGTKHNLGLEKGKHDHTVTTTYMTTGTTVVTSISPTLSTETEFSTIFTGTTSTSTKVSTSTYTTTSVSTQISTAISTETETKTKTLPAPVPFPTSTNAPGGPVHRQTKNMRVCY